MKHSSFTLVPIYPIYRNMIIKNLKGMIYSLLELIMSSHSLTHKRVNLIMLNHSMFRETEEISPLIKELKINNLNADVFNKKYICYLIYIYKTLLKRFIKKEGRLDNYSYKMIIWQTQKKFPDLEKLGL